MIKLKTLLMEADAPKLKDSEKEKARKLGLVWKGKGYGKKDDDHISFKADKSGKLVKVDKDGEKEKPKGTGFTSKDFDRDNDGMEDKPKSLSSQVSDENKDEFMDVVSNIDSNSGLDTINARQLDKSKGDSGTFYNNITLPALKQKFPGGGDEFYEGISSGVDSAIESLEYIEDKKLKKQLENELYQISNDMEEELGEDYEAAVDGVGKLPYKKMLPYLEKLDKFKKEYFSDVSESKKETREGMIKLKDVLRESKVSYLVEALQSKLLRKFTNRQNFKLDSDFYGWLAKLGVRANKVTDDMIEKTAKLSGKGIVIAVTGKKVSLPAKGKSYWRSDLEVDKGVVLSVFKDGKAVWWTKSWRESEKNRKKDINVADTKGYGFSTSENRTFGLNQFGYQNAASVKKINGVEFYKISLEENMPYMGGKEVRKLRSDIQVGSWKWRDDESFKRQNKDKYEDSIRSMYDDPEKVKAKIKRAKDYTDKLITGLIGGKPNADAKKLLKGLGNTRAPEMQAMELMRNITDAMDRLYDKVTYYNNAVQDDIDYEKRNPEHPKSYRNSPKYGKEVAEIVNLILKNKFRGYY